jgi:hypothetical protein
MVRAIVVDGKEPGAEKHDLLSSKASAKAPAPEPVKRPGPVLVRAFLAYMPRHRWIGGRSRSGLPAPMISSERMTKFLRPFCGSARHGRCEFRTAPWGRRPTPAGRGRLRSRRRKGKAVTGSSFSPSVSAGDERRRVGSTPHVLWRGHWPHRLGRAHGLESSEHSASNSCGQIIRPFVALVPVGTAATASS